MLCCLLRSLERHGFKRVLIVNGHGGNIAALAAFLPDLAREVPGLALRVTTPYEPAQQAIAPILEDQDGRASRLRGRDLPDDGGGARHGAARQAPRGARARRIGRRSRRVWRASAPSATSRPSGVIGDARRASAQKGEKLVAAVRDALAAILRDPQTWS